MGHRKTILYVILGSLGLAAFSGALAVLFTQNDQFFYRVMSTGLITAGASILAAPAAFLLEVARARRAALVGLIVIVSGYLGALGSLWAGALPGFWHDEEAWASVGVVFLFGIPTSLCVALIAFDRTRIAGWLGVSAGVVAFLGSLVAIWASALSLSWDDDELWFTAWAVASHGILVGASLAVPSVRAPWRFANIPLALASFGFSLSLIWSNGYYVEAWFGFLSATMLVAIANLLLFPKLHGGQVWVRRATITALVALTIDLDLVIVAGIEEEFLARLAAALGIGASCGTVAQFVLVAVNHWKRSDTVEEHVHLSATCPRCRQALDLPSGSSSCPACGLRFRIQVERPSCVQCGYQLYGTTSDVCPECGTSITRPPATG